MRRRIEIPADAGGFAEDKDLAQQLRRQEIVPALEREDEVLLDFKKVNYATQSFVHALISEPLKRFGEPVLERLIFKNCSPPLKSLVELVVDYSFEGFAEPDREAV